MLVRHVMARRPRSVGPDDLCLDVLRDFEARGIRHAPVLDRGRLVGVVSERDLLRALPRLVSALDTPEGATDAKTPVRAVMASEPITCTPNDPVDVVARIVEGRRISCMPVLDEDREVVGIVTVTDLLRGFTDHLADPGARALTLMWARGDAADAPDVFAVCVERGLRVTAHFETVTESGARVFLLRVRGEDGDIDAFVEDCTARGLLLMRGRAAA